MYWCPVGLVWFRCLFWSLGPKSIKSWGQAWPGFDQKLASFALRMHSRSMPHTHKYTRTQFLGPLWSNFTSLSSFLAFLFFLVSLANCLISYKFDKNFHIKSRVRKLRSFACFSPDKHDDCCCLQSCWVWPTSICNRKCPAGLGPHSCSLVQPISGFLQRGWKGSVSWRVSGGVWPLCRKVWCGTPSWTTDGETFPGGKETRLSGIGTLLVKISDFHFVTQTSSTGHHANKLWTLPWQRVVWFGNNPDSFSVFLRLLSLSWLKNPHWYPVLITPFIAYLLLHTSLNPV